MKENISASQLISSSTLNDLNDASKQIGKTVTAVFPISAINDLGSTILLTLGAEYPTKPLTIVLKDEAKTLGPNLANEVIRITGTIIDNNGKHEIIVTDPKQIQTFELPKLGQSGKKSG